MVPAKGGSTITPGDICLKGTFCIIEIKDIPSKIAAQVQTIFFGKPVINFCIQVIEIITRTVEIIGFFLKMALQWHLHKFVVQTKYRKPYSFLAAPAPKIEKQLIQSLPLPGTY